MKKLLVILGIIISLNSFGQTDFNKILNNEIYDFAIEKDTIWICTGNGLLIKLQTDGTILDSLILINSNTNNNLYSIAIDTNGVKWIATEGKGIFSYNGDTLINYTTQDGLVFDFTTSIAIDKLNRKWIATEGKGISIFDGTTWDTIKITDNKKETIYSIKIDSHDTKWISTYFGIYEYQYSVINKYNIDSYGYLSNGTLIDSKGNKWFATSGNGVYKFDGVNWTQYTTSDGLIDNWILSLYEDNYGNIWCGNKNSGISIFNGINWIPISNDILNNIEITSILVISNKLKSSSGNKIWLGTKNGLYINQDFHLNIKENKINFIKVFPNPAYNYLYLTNNVNIKSKFIISNLNGQIVSQGNILENKKIDISNIPKGIYILKIGNKRVKFIK